LNAVKILQVTQFVMGVWSLDKTRSQLQQYRNC
jgi:hypothetical protein